MPKRKPAMGSSQPSSGDDGDELELMRQELALKKARSQAAHKELRVFKMQEMAESLETATVATQAGIPAQAGSGMFESSKDSVAQLNAVAKAMGFVPDPSLAARACYCKPPSIQLSALERTANACRL